MKRFKAIIDKMANKELKRQINKIIDEACLDEKRMLDIKHSNKYKIVQWGPKTPMPMEYQKNGNFNNFNSKF